MATNYVNNQIDSAIYQCKKIRDELRSIASAARSNAHNVGESTCAQRLDDLANKYQSAIDKLRKVD